MTSRRGGLLIVGAFVTFATSAALMHSYAVFLVAFLEEFRWSRRDVPGLLGLGVRQRGKCPVRRGPGGSPRPSAARPARGRGAGARAPRKRVRTRALAAHRALRRPHDRGRQLPR